MLLAWLLCFQVATVIEVVADSLMVDKGLDVLNTDNERIAELEDQVAVLQEIIGVRQNGTLSRLRGYDSVRSLISRGKCSVLFFFFFFLEK